MQMKNAGIQSDEVRNAEVSDGKTGIGEFLHRSLEERAAEYGGKLNFSEEIDRGDPVGDEVW